VVLVDHRDRHLGFGETAAETVGGQRPARPPAQDDNSTRHAPLKAADTPGGRGEGPFERPSGAVRLDGLVEYAPFDRGEVIPPSPASASSDVAPSSGARHRYLELFFPNVAMTAPVVTS